MKRQLLACKIFFLLCSICVVCYGVDSKLLLGNEDKPIAINQSDVVYQPEEVDVKAAIDRRNIKRPTGRDCGDSEVKVLLRVVLHSSGKVTDIEVLESSSCENFQNAVIKAVRELKFIPAKKNGLSVSQYQKLGFNYTFQNRTK